MEARTSRVKSLEVIRMQPLGTGLITLLLCILNKVRFGSNNIMGQWLKAINGYTVEQIGDAVHDLCLILTTNLACCFRLLSIWSDSSRYRINPRVCNCNRSKWHSMARLGVHGSRLHDGFNMHSRLG